MDCRKLSFHFLATSLAFILASQWISCASGAHCIYSKCNLTMIENNQTQTMIDLTQYTTLMTVYSTEQETYYDFKPCGVIDDNDKDPRDDCIGAKGCKSYSATTSISAGSPDDPECFYLGGESPVVRFGISDTFDGVQVSYECDRTKKDLELNYIGSNWIDDASFQFFTLSGAGVCPKKSGGGGGGGGGNDDDDNGDVDIYSLLVYVGIGFAAIYGIVGLISRCLFIFQSCSGKNSHY